MIVVVYDMEREAPRTLFTLSPGYQNIAPSLYEVIVVENGSSQRLDQLAVRGTAENFQYVYKKPGDPSPVGALNLGASMARGQLVGFMIDGARMLSPGVLNYAVRAARAYEHPVVITPGYHLGHEAQQVAVSGGYNQESEDRLLDSVDWRSDGYELFRICSPALSVANGWLAPFAESNCVFVTPKILESVGGFHSGFDAAGGGYANLDFYREICEHPDTELVVLLGEGTFHQFHGGAMTGKAMDDMRAVGLSLIAQYEKIRGRAFEAPAVHADFMGHVPQSFVPTLGEAVGAYTRLLKKKGWHPTLSSLL